MAIEPTQMQPKAVSFGQGEKRNNGASVIQAGVTGLIAGGATGYLTGKSMPASKLVELSADKFEIRNPEKLTAEQKESAGAIKEMLQNKPELEKGIDEITDELFNGKDKMTVEEYLKANVNDKISTKEQLETLIKEQTQKAETLKSDYNNAAKTYMESKTPTLNRMNEEIAKKYVDQRNVLVKDMPKLNYGAEGSAKELLEHSKKELSPAEKALVEAEETLVKHLESISKNSEHLDVLKLAKDGELTKEAVKGYSKGAIKTQITEGIEFLSQGIEKHLPKVNSWKKAGIYGLIGAAGAIVLSKVLGFGKKAEPQAEPKA